MKVKAKIKAKKFKKAVKKTGGKFKKGVSIGKNDLKVTKNDLKVNKGDVKKGLKSAGKFAKKVVDVHVDAAATLFTGGGNLVVDEYKDTMDEREEKANAKALNEAEANARNTREQAAKRKRLDEEEENDTRGTKTGGTGKVSLRI